MEQCIYINSSTYLRKMNEEDDITRLVTSIDENDIEIIPSNEQLEFIPDHFIIENRNSYQPPIIPIQTIRSIDENDFEVRLENQ